MHVWLLPHLLLSLPAAQAVEVDFRVPTATYPTLESAVDAATAANVPEAHFILAPGYRVINATISVDGANKRWRFSGAEPPEEIDDPGQNFSTYITPQPFVWAGEESLFTVTNGAQVTLERLYFKAIERYCTDGIDNDGDGGADAGDPDCLPIFNYGMDSDIPILIPVVPGDSADTAAEIILPASGPVFRVASVSNATLNADFVQFRAFQFVREGFAIRADRGSTVNLSNSRFDFNGRPLFNNINGQWEGTYGGAIFVDASVLNVATTTFESNFGRVGGAIFAAHASNVLIDSSNFKDNHAHDGGAVFVEGSKLQVYRTKFFYNATDILQPETQDFYPYEGGAVHTEDSRVLLWNNIFNANYTFDYGAAVTIRRNLPRQTNPTDPLYDGSDPNLDILPQLYFNTATSHVGPVTGGVFWFEETEIRFDSNIVAFNGITPIVGHQWPVVTPPDVSYSDFWANVVGILGVDGAPLAPVFGGDLVVYPLSMTTNIITDPQFQQFPSLDTEYLRDPNLYVYWPHATSGIIDHGDTECLPYSPCLDPDGTRADIGAYAGPFAPTQDADGDGWANIYDCNDDDFEVFPFSPEPCDGKDNDCNGIIDDYLALYYEDHDLDGHGVDGSTLIPPVEPIAACPGDPIGSPPSGGIYTTLNDDCDDDASDRNPALTEICDNVDNDCDLLVDEGIEARDYWPDHDGDGFGLGYAGDNIFQACPPPGTNLLYSPFNADCDDDDDGIYPLITPEYRTHAPLSTKPIEFDEADRDPSFVADAIDQDCDGFDLCYADLDGDSYGAQILAGFPAQYAVDNDLFCGNLSSGTSNNALDCDDRNALAFPNGEEIPADNVDEDCDGYDACYEDIDEDGFGSTNIVTDVDLDCENDNARTASVAGDCNDAIGAGATSNPNEPEVCDGYDNDCDGVIDEIVSPDAADFFLDADGDTWGTVLVRIKACDPAPAGYVSRSGDCNDNIPTAYPEAPEVCDGVDNNCDGEVDGPHSVDAITWYADFDLDGYGNGDVSVKSCQMPEDGFTYVRAGPALDSDDNNALAGPAVSCDGCNAGPTGAPRSLPAVALLFAAALARRRRT
jgi:uncharacterized protein (TIGR03382 family)